MSAICQALLLSLFFPLLPSLAIAHDTGFLKEKGYRLVKLTEKRTAMKRLWNILFLDTLLLIRPWAYGQSVLLTKESMD